MVSLETHFSITTNSKRYRPLQYIPGTGRSV